MSNNNYKCRERFFSLDSILNPCKHLPVQVFKMFLEQRAAFGSLEEDDSSVLVFCAFIIPVIMVLSLFKDKVVSKVEN